MNQQFATLTRFLSGTPSRRHLLQCTAPIQRTSEVGSTAGALGIALAVCRT